MGEIVLAAKCTHVPTMLMSEQDGPVKGARQGAIDGHFEIARRAKQLGADTVVICDTHWVINAAFTSTPTRALRFIQNMPYEYQGNPALGDAIAKEATDRGAYTLAHHLDSLELEYGTLVPMRFMSRAHDMKVVSVAAWCTVHGHDESRIVGQAIRAAVEASDSKVLLVASGSLSHKIWPNKDYAANNGTFTISSEFNRQMDLHVLDMWQRGDHATFLKMLPEYAEYCCGEGSMHDTAMLYGALGWDQYDAQCEVEALMPVPAPNLYPDFNTIRLSHVCLNVKDLAASKTFYTEILGLQVTDESDSHIYLRAMEERGHHCIILQKSDQPGTVEVMGFKTFDEADLDKAETYFKGKGRPTSWVERPYQGKTLLTSDNMGIPLEFYHKMDRLEPIHQKYALYRGVKPLRIDHFNCFSHDVDASVAFYSDFGFRVTEYTED
ncbi:3,4-dihydroxyphenylacetate 2,3-dioxygenase [Nymphon striatum]|nr:3,4-dihydroxyphenylacetate 2,3-dioxygenase [Nymphon striatum]